MARLAEGMTIDDVIAWGQAALPVSCHSTASSAAWAHLVLASRDGRTSFRPVPATTC